MKKLFPSEKSFSFVKIILRSLWHNKIRTLLTVLGVALGVAILLAINLANDMALSNFKNSVDQVSGDSTLSVQPFQTDTLDESVLRSLRWLWLLPPVPKNSMGSEKLTRVAPVYLPIIEQTALWAVGKNKSEKSVPEDRSQSVTPGLQEVVQVLGVDFLSQNPRDVKQMKLLQQASNPLEVLDAYHVFVGESLAKQHQLIIGDTFSLYVNDGIQTFTISGILSSSGLGSAYSGSLVLMDIAQVQAVFQMPGQISRVDLKIAEQDIGWVTKKLTQQLKQQFGNTLQVVRPQQRSGQLDKMIRSYRYNLTTLSFIALLVGVFLIYNTMSISIIRRRPEIGTLRAIGFSRGHVLTLFLMEAFCIGLLGTLLGIVFGVVLSQFASTAVATTVANLYTGQMLTAFHINPVLLVEALVFGCLMTLAGSAVPLLEATTVMPSEASRRASYESRLSGLSGWLALLGFILLLAAWVSALQPAVEGLPLFGFLSAVLTIFGSALCLPLFIQGWMFLFLGGCKKLFGTEVHLAGLMLRGALARTSVAVASLMVGIAMMVSLAIMISSFRQTVTTWIEQTLKADLWIEPASKFGSKQTGRIKPETVQAIESVSGVAAVDTFFEFPIQFREQPTNLGVGRFDVLAAYGNLQFVSGELPNKILARLKQHPAVTVTESFATRFHVNQGDSLVLQTPSGKQSFIIEGVHYDYSSDLGYIVMPRFWYKKFYNDERINNLAVYAQPNEDVRDLKKHILQAVGTGSQLHIRSNQELRAEVLRIFDKTFSITYALHVIAIAVALLTIMNALFALVLEARREFGILKYLGASNRQIGKIVLSMAGMLGVWGNISGLCVGLVLSQLLIQVINKQSFGWTIRFEMPDVFLLQSVVLVLLTAFLSGLIPARMAAKTPAPQVIKLE